MKKSGKDEENRRKTGILMLLWPRAKELIKADANAAVWLESKAKGGYEDFEEISTFSDTDARRLIMMDLLRNVFCIALFSKY